MQCALCDRTKGVRPPMAETHYPELGGVVAQYGSNLCRECRRDMNDLTMRRGIYRIDADGTPIFPPETHESERNYWTQYCRYHQEEYENFS